LLRGASPSRAVVTDRRAARARGDGTVEVNEDRHADRVRAGEIGGLAQHAHAVRSQHTRGFIGNDRRPLALACRTEITPVLRKPRARCGTPLMTGRDQHVRIDYGRHQYMEHRYVPANSDASVADGSTCNSTRKTSRYWR